MELSTSVGLVRAGQRAGSAGPVAPMAQGLLPDLALATGQAMTPADLSTGFAGTDLVFALAPVSDALPGGLSLSSSGILSGTPAAAAGPLSIVVRASNAQGSADSAFSLTVADMPLSFDATLTGLTANPTHGASAETGVPLTVETANFSGALPGSIAYQWKTLESGALAGATGASYTPDAATHDGETLYCTVTPDGYPAADTAGYVIRHVPPVAAGGLWDEIVDLGSGPEFYDVAGDFSGQALVFSVTGPGCSIDPATGLLTVQTDSPVAGATVTVTAMNSGGLAQSTFTLTVEDAGIGPGPDLSVPVLDDATNTISLTVDADCTIYWRRDPTGANPDAGQVIAGGGYDSGTFAVTGGANLVDVTFAAGNDGPQEISFVAAVTPLEPSIVQTVAIDIDTTDPVLASSVPAAGAQGVGTDATPVLTFSEPIAAGAGNVTLWDVTAGVAAEVFDVIADAGIGAGQVEIAGNDLTIRPAAPLAAGNDYAILIDPGAVTDIAGNAFAGIAATTTLGFSTIPPAVVDTDFGPSFPTDHAAVWSAMQTNPFNATPEHRGGETWAAYPATVTDGGVVAVKSGSYPQLRFSVPVVVGKTYSIDADFPVGEGTWSGPLRVKIGSAINLSDYAQIDETQAGQPRVVELRGQLVTAATADLWFAVIVETGDGGGTGGNPAIAMLRVQEV